MLAESFWFLSILSTFSSFSADCRHELGRCHSFLPFLTYFFIFSHFQTRLSCTVVFLNSAADSLLVLPLSFSLCCVFYFNSFRLGIVAFSKNMWFGLVFMSHLAVLRFMEDLSRVIWGFVFSRVSVFYSLLHLHEKELILDRQSGPWTRARKGSTRILVHWFQ